ncbi:uncharacterized protein LOC131036254 isoform X1 [Cryptomeria japonica]|uniref:uncharacterized protein LOC131036254 isoform X1 n=1 Tax=Cryptomeria japonica TaxID=3369 RepID=UPI0025AC99F1|nr:uncharacterized protein LOC131036254 isoform X1 [Cryptomeria japonica]
MAANYGAGVQQGSSSSFNGNTVNQSAAAPSKASAGNGSGNSGASAALKHDPGLALEWTMEEQNILEEKLQLYANESNFVKYIKIAAVLQDKTVRDVALRCRWMSKKENGKRRKADEQNLTKKPKDRKEKYVDPSSKQPGHLVAQSNMVTYASAMPSMDNEGVLSFEPEIGGTTGHLLEQNAKAFEQITANLASYRIRENINLFCQARDNIFAILNDMKDMPGIMSQMPPLPVKINGSLADSILPTPTQGMLYADHCTG